MAEDFDFAQESKKVFVNFLILNCNLIEQKIYFGGSATSAIRPLKGLIDSLDAQSKKKLKQQYEDLQSFEANVYLCSRERMEQIYSQVLSYLHSTYLKEMRFARPKYPSKKLGMP